MGIVSRGSRAVRGTASTLVLAATATVAATLAAVPTAVPAAADEPDVLAAGETGSAVALGVIVTPRDPDLAGSAAAAADRRVAAAAEDLLETDVSRRVRADGTRVLTTEEPVAGDEAAAVAAALAARPEVARAEPDYLMRPTAASPVRPDDPGFAQQWALWDTAARAAGGFGTRAPAAWRAGGQGSPSVVVAVLDTGITRHADLDAGVVAGYDMISRASVPHSSSGIDRDATPGRDPDPSDTGDWMGAATARACFDDLSVPAQPSSWHGTHVSGIVAARAGNGVGVAGNAPGVRVQPVRVLGQCGGLTSDIADAVRWAAGGTVAGVPANRTPARVINLSLGGPDRCGPAMQSAVDDARRRGAVVVAAAGNEASDVRTSSPASCRGVVAVSATDRAGRLAPFSNRGSGVAVSAPGVGILSTFNSGTFGPGAQSYALMSGTSQAAPAVAAGVALAASRSPRLSAPLLEGAVRRSVQPFGAGSARGGGSGVLDLGRLFVPTALPRVQGRLLTGATLTGLRGSWAWGTVVSRGWYRDGRLVSRSSTYRLSRADVGRQVRFGEVVAGGGSVSNVALSSAYLLPAAASRTVLTSSRTAVRSGRSVRLRAVVSGAIGRPAGRVVFFSGARRLGSVQVSAGSARLTVPSRRIGVGRHRIRAVFVSAEPGYRGSTDDARVRVRPRR